MCLGEPDWLGPAALGVKPAAAQLGCGDHSLGRRSPRATGALLDRHAELTFAHMAVWASDSYDGIPAGVVHVKRTDDFGRPSGPVCGAPAEGLWYFAAVDIDQVPPEGRCPVCAAQQQ